MDKKIEKVTEPKNFRFRGHALFIAILIFLTGYFLGLGSGSGLHDRGLQAITDAYRTIQNDYPKKYNKNDLVEGAISGMVGGVGDPYSVYIPKKDLNNFFQDLEGQFEGIGVEISVKDGNYVIVAPLENSPAQIAGLKAGDIILKIDGKDVKNLTLDEVVSRIRGKKGTAVKIEVSRTGETQNPTFKVTRDIIKVSSLYLKFQGDTAIIRIVQFDNNTYSLFQNAMKEIKKKKVNKIILDLRNDPGGYLEQSVKISEEFLNKGQIIFYEKSKFQTKATRSSKNGSLRNYKTVILINEGSASASEIVAAALHDNKKATLVGVKSFGKGTVQNINQLATGGAIKLTSAFWLTPKKKSIDKNGILPDFKIEISKKDQVAGLDPQLNYALEVLK